MSTRLGAALREVAEAGPAVGVPPGLFGWARRRARRRRAAGIAATVGVLALLVLAVPVVLEPAPVPPASPASEGLPATVVVPPGHTADVRYAPLSAALVVFTSLASYEGYRSDSYPLDLVGPRDAYRVYDRPEWTTASAWTPTFLLAPDGRHVLMAEWRGDSDQRTRVLDVTTGKVRTLAGGAPLAWGPDSRWAVLAHFDSDPGAAVRLITLRVVDTQTGAVRTEVPLPASPGTMDELTAALSGDGGGLAVQAGDELSVYHDTTLVWQHGVGTNWLAGPGAWTPDGTLATLNPDGLLTALDAADGRKVAAQTYPDLATALGNFGTPVRLVGWRGGQPVVTTANRVLALEPGDIEAGTTTPLLAAPGSVAELQVATDALRQPLRAAGTPDPGPFTARYRSEFRWLLTGLGVLAGVGALLALRRRYRRR